MRTITRGCFVGALIGSCLLSIAGCSGPVDQAWVLLTGTAVFIVAVRDRIHSIADRADLNDTRRI